MSTDIQHFLVVYDIAGRDAHVDRYGQDYDTAIDAYAKAEQLYRGRDDVEVVLLSADSIDTIKKTHSSYFNTREQGFERFFDLGDLVASLRD
ncbi:MAG TPA: hypothetical protein VMD79_07340 [Solirubrobacteraceae bacterium]|nr:hypothetical protein [Solirubrobacteraceae bacterium]